MHKILIVENDSTLAQTLKMILSEFEAEIFHAATLDAAYYLLEKAKFDLVLLDRLLDDGDGLEIAEYLNDISFPTKIIILSTVGDLENSLQGLKNGADLYLPKPFSKRMLKLYVQKALHSEKINNTQTISAGKIVLAPNTGLVTTPGFTCQLRKKESEILHFLMVRKNQIISREQIIEGIWGSSMRFPTHSTIDAYVRKIRVILKEYAGIIKTIRGFGYSVVENY